MFFAEKIESIRKYFNLSNTGLEKILGLSNGYISNIEKSGTDNPGKLLIALSKKKISIDWFLTGKGSMFLDKSETDSPEAPAGETIIASNGVFIHKSSYSRIGNVTMVPSRENSDTLPLPPPKEGPSLAHTVRAMMVFEIPLLTKEQVLQFDPVREIPTPKAHSGEYPDYMLVPMPRRFVEYSTDLRAIVVFNSLMSPLLNPGEVAIFQATGWSGDGVYLYRMKGDLYISHVRFDGTYHLTKEFMRDVDIPYDAGSFEAIGRVRAVVREIP